MGEIEKHRHQKEKELMIQKEDLEFLLKGIRDSVGFSEKLVCEGSGAEIASSHNLVGARFGTLEKEMNTAPLLPISEVAELAGVEEAREMITGIGMLIVKDLVAPEKSSVVRGENDTVVLNQKYSFEVILVDQKGNKVIGGQTASSAGIQVKIEGPSKNVKVLIF